MSDAPMVTERQIAALPEKTVSPDPEDHIAAVEELFDSGATIVNIHSGQADQQKVIEFYSNWVLPELASRRQAKATPH